MARITRRALIAGAAGAVPSAAIFSNSQQPPAKMLAEIRPHNGAPTLFLNNQPAFGLVQLVANIERTNVEATVRGLAAAGVHLYNVLQVAGGSERTTNPAAWVAEKTFDWSRNDQKIDKILELDPAARFFFWVTLFSPDWWDAQHMEEMIVFSDGVVRRKVRESVRGNIAATQETHGSWASEKWREAVGYALREFLRHVEGKYGDRIVLYRLGSSFSTEWYWPGSVEGWIADYSLPNRNRFRSWLRAKYRTDEALRQAWGAPTITFDQAEIPPHLQRTDGLTASRFFGRAQMPHWLWYWNPYIFRHPVADQAVVDYTLYHSEVVVETIDYFARIVREETGNRKLVAAPYGYSHLRGNIHPHLDGKNAHAKMMESRYVQVQTSPPLSTWSLTEPERKEGHSTDSMRLRNQMFGLEVDAAVMGRPGEERLDAERLKKKFNLFFIISGMGYPLMNLQQRPEVWPLVGQMNRIGARSLHHHRESVSEIAIIGDEESLMWMNLDAVFKVGSPYNAVLTDASVIGAPYDFYLHNDLDHPAMPDYKLYIITDLFSLTGRELAALERKVKRNHSTVLWMYAPGFLDEFGNPSVERVRKLVGMTIELENLLSDRREVMESFASALRQGVGLQQATSVARGAPGSREIGPNWRPPSPGRDPEATYLAPQQLKRPLVLKTLRSDHPIAAGIPEGTVFGLDERLGPRFFVNDAGAVPLGSFVEGGQTGFAVKALQDWTSVFVGTLRLTPLILRSVAKHAGVHLYTPDDVVMYANASYLAVRNREKAGARRFQLPRRAYVRELYSGKTVGEAVGEFSFPMEAATSYLFYWGREPY